MSQLSPEQLAALAKDDIGPLTMSLIITFTVLSGVAVCLRIFTRVRYIGRQLGWEASIYQSARAADTATETLPGLCNRLFHGETFAYQLPCLSKAYTLQLTAIVTTVLQVLRKALSTTRLATTSVLINPS